MPTFKETVEKERERLRQEAKKPKTKTESVYRRGRWTDGVYHDSYGYAWGVNYDLQTVCLGRSGDLEKIPQESLCSH